MKHVVAGLTFASLALLSLSAMAEEPKVHTTPEVRIVGHPARPSAAVEVSRARMKLAATTPTLSSLGKVNDAAKKDPF